MDDGNSEPVAAALGGQYRKPILTRLQAESSCRSEKSIMNKNLELRVARHTRKPTADAANGITSKIRIPFLKWAGRKTSIIATIKPSMTRLSRGIYIRTRPKSYLYWFREPSLQSRHSQKGKGTNCDLSTGECALATARSTLKYQLQQRGYP
jgi:hypothetical protein